jgi:protein-S-isoprenylcysteine O-methyltransferase Ste14
MKIRFEKLKTVIFYVLGIVLIFGFMFLYITRFTFHPGVPPMIRYFHRHLGKEYLLIFNSIIFILFLIFLPYRKEIEWKSNGIFSAFVLSLFGEMFGIPLSIYLLQPIFDYNFTIKLPFIGRFELFSHFFPFGWVGMIIGSYLTLIGMIIVFIGWTQVYRSKDLVKNGIYKYIRHPQYTGFYLIMIGWLLHWLTPITLVLFPILLVLYYRLAKIEERELQNQFGIGYKRYISQASMFLPLRLFKQKLQ